MSDRGHDRLQDMTAAYVLGALDASEREELDVHLRSCARCREDLLVFAPIPALLSRLDEVDVRPADEGSADALVAAVRADVTRLSRSRRYWRLGAAAAAAVVAVVAFLSLVDRDASDGRSDGVALVVEPATAGVDARVVATEHGWGTYVYLSADALPRRDAYALWVVGADGSWEAAGTWAPSGDDAAHLGGSSRLTLGQIDRIVVTSSDRDDEILVAR